MRKPSASARKTAKSKASASAHTRPPKNVAAKGKFGYSVYDQIARIRDAFQASLDGAIDANQTDEPKPTESVEARLAVLDRYVQESPGQPISKIVLEVFPEIVAVAVQQAGAKPLPRQAPELWTSGKRNQENPPTFIRRVYKPWLGQITRVQIGKLDPKLYRALNNWLGHNAMPPDLDLPTTKEANDRWLARIATLSAPVVGDEDASSALRRVASLMKSRGQNQR